MFIDQLNLGELIPLIAEIDAVTAPPVDDAPGQVTTPVAELIVIPVGPLMIDQVIGPVPFKTTGVKVNVENSEILKLEAIVPKVKGTCVKLQVDPIHPTLQIHPPKEQNP